MWQRDLFLKPPFQKLTCLKAFANLDDWPSLDDLNRLLMEKKVLNHQLMPLKVVTSPLKKPKRPSASYLDFYEPRIYLSGEVWTRFRHAHDFFNACVWLEFPKLKAVLNARHHHIFTQQNPLPIAKLSNSRTEEQDALTLFDEGGAVHVLGPSGQEYDVILIGHGAYECFYYGRNSFGAGALRIQVDESYPTLQQVQRHRLADQIISDIVALPEMLLSSKELVTTPAEKFL